MTIHPLSLPGVLPYYITPVDPPRGVSNPHGAKTLVSLEGWPSGLCVQCMGVMGAPGPTPRWIHSQNTITSILDN